MSVFFFVGWILWDGFCFVVRLDFLDNFFSRGMVPHVTIICGFFSGVWKWQ